MGGPFAGGDTQDGAGDSVNHNLSFQGMPLLFTAVPGPLIFSGRSQGTSLTSTSTAFCTASPVMSERFPGNEKR